MNYSNVKMGSPNSAFTPVKKKNDDIQLPIIVSNDYPDPKTQMSNRKNAFVFVKNLFDIGRRDSKIWCMNQKN